MIHLIVNGESTTLHQGDCLTDLLMQLHIPLNRRGIAVAVNDEVVPRSGWPQQTVRNDDRIEIVTAVQGG